MAYPNYTGSYPDEGRNRGATSDWSDTEVARVERIERPAHLRELPREPYLMAPERTIVRERVDDRPYRLAQALWLIIGFIEIMLALRFVLRIMAANPESPFAAFTYALTAPFVWPFATLVETPAFGGSVIEWFTVIAMLVFWLIGWMLTKVIQLIWGQPVTVREYHRAD